MRTIKFRGKRLDNGEWAIGDLEYCRAKNVARIHTYDAKGYYECQHEVHPDTVGQFTGVKDKNRKDVYEGDIIECMDSDNQPIRHFVKYCDEYVGYIQYLPMGDGPTCKPYNGGLVSQGYIDDMGKYVVGNIHDNPELLKNE